MNVAVLGALAGRQTSPAWSKYIEITIDCDRVSDTLSNFPLPVKISAASGQADADVSCVFDEIGANYLKLSARDSGDNELYVEVQEWDNANERGFLHIKVPSIASGEDTKIRLYYDSTKDDNTDYVGLTGSTAGKAVWDSNYKGVWHLVGDPSTASNMKDSTTNGNDGQSSTLDADDQITDGLFGGECDFDAEYLTFSDSDSLSITAELTVEAVFKRALETAGNYGIASKYIGSGNQRSYNLTMDCSAKKVKGFLSSDGDASPLTSLTGTTVTTDTDYYYAALLYKAADTTAALRVNASEEESTSSAVTSIYDSTVPFYIGLQYSTAFPWTGRISEVRVSNVKRSTAWCDATYYGLFDALLTFSAEIAG